MSKLNIDDFMKNKIEEFRHVWGEYFYQAHCMEAYEDTQTESIERLIIEALEKARITVEEETKEIIRQR